MTKFSIFQRFFLPMEVKAVLMALAIEERKLREAENKPLFGPHSGFNLINSEIRRLIMSESGVLVLKIREGVAPRTLAYLAIANYTARELLTGRYHIHRGILSMPGQSLFSLWAAATAELETAGMHSSEETIEGKRNFHQQIKELG
ncbi:hypothetical protein ACIPIN_19355 [Pseudomonas sp. NPDC087697]|uniref:hypothetical protein n=1 Tax=Pseudomonas sp. NPDC087697 TaxID=3364447 RepID=UPI0038249979